MVTRGDDVVLPGVGLLLNYVYSDDIDTPGQNNSVAGIVL